MAKVIKKQAKSEEEQIRSAIADFLKILSINGDFELATTPEEVTVVLQTEDSGLVIGYHGEGLEAVQLLLSLAIAKTLGRFVRVILEVGDYRKNRSSWLENLALNAKERALYERREVSLPNLKAWERRVVHILLQNDEEVESESLGEGRDRTLVVRPKAA